MSKNNQKKSKFKINCRLIQRHYSKIIKLGVIFSDTLCNHESKHNLFNIFHSECGCDEKVSSVLRKKLLTLFFSIKEK